jgi:methionyl aminopeptidase
MLVLKTAEEIELIRESSILVSQTLAEVAEMVVPGISTKKLDKRAEEFIRDNGGLPGFKGYNRYPATLCTSVNSEVVHGIPSQYELKDGDIVSIDCGVLKNGFYGDSAYTFEVGEVAQATRELLETTKQSLFEAIKFAVVGRRMGDIGNAVQKYCEDRGYSVVREMVGHGLGKGLHEEPEVPNYGRKGNGTKLQNGMVLCIEPMINMGKRHIRQEKDGWTIKAQDNRPSAHFELTVAVVNNEKADVLSTFSYIEEVLSKKVS